MHPFYFQSYDQASEVFHKNQNEKHRKEPKSRREKHNHMKINKFIHEDQDHQRNFNSLQRFTRDSSKRQRTKVLSFSKPKASAPDPLGYEIVGLCPSLKIYAEQCSNNISSEEQHVISMLKTPIKGGHSESNTVDHSLNTNFRQKPERGRDSFKLETSCGKAEQRDFDMNRNKKTPGDERRVSYTSLSSHATKDDRPLLTSKDVAGIVGSQIQTVKNELMGAINRLSTKIDVKESKGDFED